MSKGERPRDVRQDYSLIAATASTYLRSTTGKPLYCNSPRRSQQPFLLSRANRALGRCLHDINYHLVGQRAAIVWTTLKTERTSLPTDAVRQVNSE